MSYPPYQDPSGPPQYQPPGGVPYVPMAPPPKRGIGGGAIAIIIVGVVVVVCGSLCVLANFLPNSKSNADSGPGDAGAAASADGNTASTAGNGSALLALSGSEVKQSKAFTTGREWRLSYSYDCTAQSTNSFLVFEHASDGSVQDILVKETDRTGTRSAVQRSDAGTHYLEVISNCDWSLTVTDN